MATDFFRVNVNDTSFIRGAARLLVAPITQAFPAKISDVISLSSTATTADNDEQTVSVSGGTPTGGGFTLTLDTGDGTGPYTTSTLAYDATAANIQAAIVALPNVGSGNATATGGPLPATPVVVTFGGTLADMYVPQMTVESALIGGGQAVVAHTQEGSGALGLYDAQPGWSDLGATKNGITITINNGEDTFDIDQQLGIIGSQPNGWTVTVGTALAESTEERMQVAWEGSEILIDATPASGPEKEIGFGAPPFYTQRRVAVLFQRPSGYIRGYFFRICQRSPSEAAVTFAKTGDQQTIPLLFNCLADTSITDVKKQFFIIRDQALS
jgi:hypothetical protein